MDIRKLAEEEQEYLVALRRKFHSHPELSLKEYETADEIGAQLYSFGIESQRVGETGVLGIIRGAGADTGRVVVLRADIDALPITESHHAEYESQNPGVMHACGHDAHTACLLGAAKILQKNRAQFGGEVRLVFQPAEEIGAGAEPFIKAGVLQGAQRVFGLHVASDLESGRIGVKKGINNASVDHFRIVITGKAAHVSTPQQGVDALYIASQTVVAAQALVTRMTSPVNPVIIGIGMLHSGTSYNIVAGEAVLEGTTRTISRETRAKVKELLTNTARQIAGIYGGEAEVVWTDYASPLINHAEVCDEAAEVIRKLWDEQTLVTDRALSLGGDNFAEYLLNIPGAYVYLGTANHAKPNTCLAVHNDGFDIDEAVLQNGAALYAGYAAAWLGGRETYD